MAGALMKSMQKRMAGGKGKPMAPAVQKKGTSPIKVMKAAISKRMKGS